MYKIELMRPALPAVADLIPYLLHIDESRHYTNFGSLHNELLEKLLDRQAEVDGGRSFGVLTANATQGLELALSALNLPVGSKVAVPAFTFPATATAVKRSGHFPVAVDIDPSSWLLTPKQMPLSVKESGIAAVVPVAALGMPQDAQSWSEWSKDVGIPVIVDAAAAYGGQRSAEGVVCVFSLHATKPLSCVEGGFVLTGDPSLADRLKAMTNFGIGLTESHFATNAKVSEYHAAVGLAHLKMWPEQTVNRLRAMKLYQKLLAPLDGKVLSFQRDTGLFAPSVLSIRLANADLRERLENSLAENGIQCRRWYWPLLQENGSLGSVEVMGDLPNAKALSNTLLGLPFFPDLTEEDIRLVVDCVHQLTLG